MFTLQNDYAKAVDDSESFRRKLITLEAQSVVKFESDVALELLASKDEVKNLNSKIDLKKNNHHQTNTKELNADIKEQEISNKTRKEVFDKLHSDVKQK